jgi:hypothetical protein
MRLFVGRGMDRMISMAALPNKMVRPIEQVGAVAPGPACPKGGRSVGLTISCIGVECITPLLKRHGPGAARRRPARAGPARMSFRSFRYYAKKAGLKAGDGD